MNIADEPGVYKDFSGRIDYEDTDCVVRNADFEIDGGDLEEGYEIIFEDVVFVSGVVLFASIKNGLNLNAKIKRCDIEYLINKGGEILSCDWRDGIFEGGVFKSNIWHDGIWIDGEWSNDNRDRVGRIKVFPPNMW